MKTCPVCNKKYKNAGFQRHMDKMHPEYKPIVEPDPEVNHPLPPELPVEEPEVAPQIIQRVVKSNDREGTLDLIFASPWIVIAILFLFKAVSDPYFISGIVESDIVQIYIYIFSNLNNPGAIMILAMTMIALGLLGYLLHRFIWRLAFPDMIMKQRGIEPVFIMNKDGKRIEKSKPVYIQSSKECRIYFTIGRGRLDNWYRRKHGLSKPSTVTFYVKRNFLIPNPFRPLSSCDKMIMTDPGYNRWSRDGLYKIVVRASNTLIGHQGNDLIYILSDKGYSHMDFDTNWHDATASDIIKEGLPELARASMVNPDIQQDQLRRNRYFMPEQDVKEDLELKEEKLKMIELQKSKMT